MRRSPACCCPAPRRIQSLFNALGEEAQGKTIGLGGDGRYFNKEAVQVGAQLAGCCCCCHLLLLLLLQQQCRDRVKVWAEALVCSCAGQHGCWLLSIWR